MKRNPFRLYGSYVAVLLELLALLKGCDVYKRQYMASLKRLFRFKHTGTPINHPPLLR